MPTSIDFLVVAGGGSGGNHNTTNGNGGGGGGGVLNGISLTPGGGTLAITIGAGGAAVASATTGTGNKGTNSSFGSTWVAQGGGGGTSSGVSFNTAVNSGGSGGGYSNPNGAGTSGSGSATQTSIAGAIGYGNAGGSSAVAWTGAGGGGAGSAGVSGSGSAPGGNGGAGFITSISGVSKGYAGGGGGGGNSSERAGDGFHGGGRGAGTTSYYAYNVYTAEINATTLGSGTPTAVVNSGGGGGGGSYWSPNGGWSTGSGQGGSGIVIIRTASADPVFPTTGSPTITVAGGYRVYTFNSSGSITTGPVNTVAPVISGSIAVGSVLTSTLGTWTGSGTITYGYQWARNAINISGATSSTYTTVTADGDKTITCNVTATDDAGASTVASNSIFILAPTSAYIEYLMVGGGGGGGGNRGGGGGAGGVLLASANAASIGQSTYTTPGTYSWTAPAGVTSVSVVAVGGGGGGGQTWSSGGGGGGGLGYKTSITVVPGQSYTVVVGEGGPSLANATTPGSEGGNSYFDSLETVAGYGSGRGGPGSTAATPAFGGGYTGDGGGRGGNGATDGNWQKAGAGAGGYAGRGADSGASTGTAAPAGGGGGAGGYYSSTYGQPGGGGVGILGQGASGASTGNAFSGGRGGSGGQNGADGEPNSNTSVKGMIYGGAYGGGGGGSGTSTGGGVGGSGAVRIMWGAGRTYPVGAPDIFTTLPELFITKGTYTITVGSGGAGALAGSSPAAGSNGVNTVFGSIIAYGGGGGGSSAANARSGGSGGGGSGQSSGFVAGTSPSSQGRSGGTGLLNYPGGGGGANTAGANTPGNGGAGIESSILGTSYYWGGGGGGAGFTGNAGIGGIGGGGGGAPKVSGGGIAGTGGISAGTDGGVSTLSNAAANVPGGAGGINTGSGGGGGSAGTATNGGGAGGSGIVVIRYPDSYYPAVAAVNVDAGYPIVSGGYRLYKWSSSGAIQLGAPGTPVNSVLPTVSVSSGSVTNGLPDAVLSCNVGTWTGDATIVYTYQWTNNSNNIVGATSSTYTTLLTDGFKTISCIVTATNSVDSITVAASNGLFVLLNGFVSVNTELGFGPAQTILTANSIQSTLAESQTTALSVNGGPPLDTVNTGQITFAARTDAITDGNVIVVGGTTVVGATNQQYWH